ncbi:MAG TPA: c-type cytochrome [Hyphomicrobiales bacterium]|nr:c-type cytochrome [Hyphomicrobiales bacterium]
MNTWCVRLLAATLALACWPGVAAVAQTKTTVLDGVYTAQQATRGKRAYARYCEECHLGDLEGGALEPPLVSVLFLDAWREDYLYSLYDFIATRMPKSKEHRAGSLKPQEYLDILVYILQRNDFPSGSQTLTPEALHEVLLVSHEGPQPLPPNATVRTVGCLEAAEGGYRLQQGAAPSRVRSGDETDEVELARSAEQPLGEATFTLNNLDVLTTADTLQALVGHKVQAKGVLNGTDASARIFVLSMESAGDCSL